MYIESYELNLKRLFFLISKRKFYIIFIFIIIPLITVLISILLPKFKTVTYKAHLNPIINMLNYYEEGIFKNLMSKSATENQHYFFLHKFQAWENNLSLHLPQNVHESYQILPKFKKYKNMHLLSKKEIKVKAIEINIRYREEHKYRPLLISKISSSFYNFLRDESRIRVKRINSDYKKNIKLKIHQSNINAEEDLRILNVLKNNKNLKTTIDFSREEMGLELKEKTRSLASIILSNHLLIVKPDQQGIWIKGKEYDIIWTFNDRMPKFVKIRLYDILSRKKLLNISNKAPNNGYFKWSIPDNLKEGKYRIRVKTLDNKIYDDSEIFTLRKLPETEENSNNNNFYKNGQNLNTDLFRYYGIPVNQQIATLNLGRKILGIKLENLKAILKCLIWYEQILESGEDKFDISPKIPNRFMNLLQIGINQYQGYIKKLKSEQIFESTDQVKINIDVELLILKIFLVTLIAFGIFILIVDWISLAKMKE